jgi:hypothetical protein
VEAARFRPMTQEEGREKGRRSGGFGFVGSAILCLIGFLCNFLDRKRNRNFSHVRGLVLFESYSLSCAFFWGILIF